MTKLALCITSRGKNEKSSFDVHDNFFTDGELGVSSFCRCIAKFEKDDPELGHYVRLGWIRINDFRPLSHRISETLQVLQDRTNVALRKFKRAFDLYQNQCHWFTLN